MAKVPKQWNLKHLDLDNCESFHYQTLKAFAIHNDIRVPHHGTRNDLCSNIRELIRIRKVSGRVDGLVNKLRDDLVEKDVKVQSLESQIQALITRIDSMKHSSSKSKNYLASIELLKQTIEELKLAKEGKAMDEATIADLTQKNNVLEQNLRDIKSESDTKIEALNKEREALSKRLQSHKQAQHAALREQASKYGKQTEELKQQLKELEDRNRVLEGEKVLLAAANLDNQKLIEERNRLQNEMQLLLHARNNNEENPRLTAALNMLTEKTEQLGQTVQGARKLEERLEPVLQRLGISINLDTTTNPNNSDITERLEGLLRRLEQFQPNSAENEKQVLQSTITNLQKDKNQLELALEDARNKLVQNTPSLSPNAQQLSENLQRIESVQTELERVQKIEKEAQNKILELQGQLTAGQQVIEQQRNDRNQERKRAREQYNELEATTNNLQTIVNQREQNIKDLKRVIQNLQTLKTSTSVASREQIEELENNLNLSRQEKMRLETDLGVATESVKSLKQDKEQLLSKVGKLQTMLKTVQLRLSKAARSNALLKQQNHTSQVSAEQQYQESIKSLRQQLEHEQELSKLNNIDLNQSRQEIAQLESRIEEMSRIHSNNSSNDEATQERMARLAAQFESKNKEIEAVNKTLQGLERDLLHKESLLHKSIERQGELQKTVNDLQHRLGQDNRDVNDLNARLEQELSSVQKSLAQKIKDEEVMRQLAQERLDLITERDKEIARLTNAYKSAHKQVTDYEAIYPRLSSPVKQPGFFASLFGSSKNNNNSPVLTAPASRRGFTVSRYEKQILSDEQRIASLTKRVQDLEQTNYTDEEENSRLAATNRAQQNEIDSLREQLSNTANKHVDMHDNRIEELEQELAQAKTVINKQVDTINEINSRGTDVLNLAYSYLPGEIDSFRQAWEGSQTTGRVTRNGYKKAMDKNADLRNSQYVAVDDSKKGRKGGKRK